VNIRNRNEK